MARFAHRTRWLIVALLVILLLALAIPAGAVKPARPDKAQNVPWYGVGVTCNSDQVDLTSPIAGHVNLNTPSGEVTMIINGTISTLLPNTQYALWVRDFGLVYAGPSVYSYTPLGYYALGYFTTDEYGNGWFHFNISQSDLPDGTYSIQLAVNTTPPIGCTVAATEKYAIVETG